MTKSFKLFFTGAVGIAIAASGFASDAYAFKLAPAAYHPVGGWARTPSFQGPFRPGVALGYRNVMGVRTQYQFSRGFAGMMAARNNNLRVQQQQYQYQQQARQQAQQQWGQQQAQQAKMKQLNDYADDQARYYNKLQGKCNIGSPLNNTVQC